MSADVLAIIALAIVVAMGLLAGRAAYAFYLAFRTHNPTCPHKDEVLANAKRVTLDVDELTRPKEGLYG